MTNLNTNLDNEILELQIRNILMEYGITIEVSKKKLLDIVRSTISFNKKLSWKNNSENLYIATTPKELLSIYKLRSDIYNKLNYNHEFPDIIKGLNFDLYDKTSAILYTKINNCITGTCRIIFDSKNKLPIDNNYSLDYMRIKNKQLGEVSRLIINNHNEGLNQEFKTLTQGVYSIILNNSISISLSVITNEHFKLYRKFGGFIIEKKLNTYGHINKPFIISSWDVSKVSNFFKKIFLKKLEVA